MNEEEKVSCIKNVNASFLVLPRHNLFGEMFIWVCQWMVQINFGQSNSLLFFSFEGTRIWTQNLLKFKMVCWILKGIQGSPGSLLCNCPWSQKKKMGSSAAPWSCIPPRVKGRCVLGSNLPSPALSQMENRQEATKAGTQQRSFHLKWQIWGISEPVMALMPRKGDH
jgi:hypothetical protein